MIFIADFNIDPVGVLRGNVTTTSQFQVLALEMVLDRRGDSWKQRRSRVPNQLGSWGSGKKGELRWRRKEGAEDLPAWERRAARVE